MLVWAVFLWAANKTLVISLAHEWLSLFPQSHVQHASKKVKLLKFVEKKRGKIWAYRGKKDGHWLRFLPLLLATVLLTTRVWSWSIVTQTKSTGLFVVYSLIIIINSYWTRLSKILWFVSGKQINIWPWKINDLQYTDKSRYFAATELVNYFIIQWLSYM